MKKLLVILAALGLVGLAAPTFAQDKAAEAAPAAAAPAAVAPAAAPRAAPTRPEPYVIPKTGKLGTLPGFQHVPDI